MLVVRSGSLGLTVRGGLARVAVGDHVGVHGTRLPDATLRLSGLRMLGHNVGRARVRGTVLRLVRRGTLVATGRNALLIRSLTRRFASASDHGALRSGEIAEFRIRFDDDVVIEATPPIALGQAAVVRIEGAVVSRAPFVVSVDGLPVTITLARPG